MINSRGIASRGLSLEYPKSLGVHEDYAQAQRSVDYLADHDFPVQNLAIVGTELKSVERVTGHLTRRTVATAAALSGLWLGIFVGLAFALFSNQNGAGYLITTPIMGALFMVVWSQVGFSAATGNGTRDFSSLTQVVATKYEVLVEHRFADQARTLLLQQPQSL
jgi:hypothetical protein